MDETATPLVTVVVVTYRGHEFISECLDSLAAQTLPHDVLVIDNASEDGTAALLAERYPDTPSLRLPTNTGFAGGVDAALSRITSPLCALLNDDAVADPRWLEALIAALTDHPTAAAATSRMLLSAPADADTDGRINNLGVALTSHGFGYDIGLGRDGNAGFSSVVPVFGFSGGAALLRMDALREIDGFPAYFFLYYEDTDVSWRLRLGGHEVISVPGAVVRHRHSATVGTTSRLFHRHNERNRLLMVVRCGTASLAVGEILRFGLTTASLTVKRLLRRPVPAAANASPRLRFGVLIELVGRLPSTLAQRRRIGRRAVLSRAAVQDRWLGVDPLLSEGS
jgi:GT2 family glycosyltransferase